MAVSWSLNRCIDICFKTKTCLNLVTGMNMIYCLIARKCWKIWIHTSHITLMPDNTMSRYLLYAPAIQMTLSIGRSTSIKLDSTIWVNEMSNVGRVSKVFNKLVAILSRSSIFDLGQ